MDYVIVFFLGMVTSLYMLAGYTVWRYATFRASGARGVIFNPTDAHYLGLPAWLIAWPILMLIESQIRWGGLNLKDVFNMDN